MEEVKYIPGDLVMFNGRVMPITNIDYQTPYRVTIQMENGYCTISPKEIDEYIKPVLLTSNILMNNGWKYVECHEVYQKNIGDVDIQVENVLEKWIAGIFFDTFKEDIKYCHELQHLLFGLGLPMNLKV